MITEYKAIKDIPVVFKVVMQGNTFIEIRRNDRLLIEVLYLPVKSEKGLPNNEGNADMRIAQVTQVSL